MVTRPRLGSRFAIRPPKKRFPKALQPPHFPFPISLNSLSAPPSPLSFPSRSIALNTSHKNISVIRFGQRSIRSAFCKIIKALPLRPIVILSSFSVVLHLQFPQDLIDLIGRFVIYDRLGTSHPFGLCQAFCSVRLFFQVPDFRSHKRKMDKRRVSENE